LHSIRLYETLRREFEFGKVGDPEDGKREFHDENAELRLQEVMYRREDGKIKEEKDEGEKYIHEEKVNVKMGTCCIVCILEYSTIKKYYASIGKIEQ
jgi:hypothetical protein